MYVCMCVCVCVCVYMYVCMYVCICVCVYMYVYVCVCVCVCMYMCVYVCVCVYLCMYVCIYSLCRFQIPIWFISCYHTKADYCHASWHGSHICGFHGMYRVRLLLVFISRSVELLALQLALWVLQFYGRDTLTINERPDQEMEAACMVILRPLFDIEILDPQRRSWHPKRVENRPRSKRFESTSERLVTSLETNGHDSIIKIGSPIPAQGTMRWRMT